MPQPTIVMESFGGLGNRMFRYMLADLFSRRLGHAPIRGANMPEWGMIDPDAPVIDGPALRTGRVHQVDVEALLQRAQDEQAAALHVDAFAMRLEYFEAERERFAALFAAQPAIGQPIADDELAIHIRAGDIVDGLHPDYMPLPLAYYHRLVFETGQRPVFVGQLHDNWYCAALRAQFPQARFIAGSISEDFQTLRSARHVALAISSFSWMAAWLSDVAQTIHVPQAGLFHPAQRPDIDLVSHTDPRFAYHPFAPGKYTGSPEQKAIIASPPAWAQPTREAFLNYRPAPPHPEHLDAQTLAKRLQQAVEARDPFAFVRLGDGEGALLAYPQHSEPQDLAYLHSHFGEQITHDGITTIQHGLQSAIAAADIIGLRDDIWLGDARLDDLHEQAPDFFERFRASFPLRHREAHNIDEHGARRVWRLFDWARQHYPMATPACSQWASYDIAAADGWRAMLKGVDRLNLVHCSPHLPALLQQRWNIPVRAFTVPDKAVQQQQWQEHGLAPQPHFPDAFWRLCDALHGQCAGEVFLVGAGLIGKAYLPLIKAQGGVALDLGALLDAWEGRATRPQIYANKTANQWEQGQPVPAAFQLTPAP